MIETVFSSELPVNESLVIRKHRLISDDLANATPEELAAAPRLCVVTGVHGDELEGQYVAFELQRRLREEGGLKHGIVDVYPAINPLGINTIQRGIPQFDLDLNRTFPGDPQGSMAEALAAAVCDDLEGASAVVDIHASNIFLTEMPQVRINVITAEELVPLAALLNVDFIWVHASATVLQSTLAYSLNSRNTPTLVVETGVGMRLTHEYDERLVNGLFRLMGHFGMYEGELSVDAEPIVSNDGEVSFLNAGHAGIFLPEAEHGQYVTEGQLIGRIVDPLCGEVREEVKSPIEGLLFTLRAYPVVYPGSLVGRILKRQAPEEETAALKPVFGEELPELAEAVRKGELWDRLKERGYARLRRRANNGGEGA